MANENVHVPIQGLLLLTLAMIVGPMLVTAALVLMIDGRVPDFSRGTDIAEFTIAIGFGLVVWGIGIRAYWRRGAGAANRGTGIIAKIQPAFWLLGIALGTAAALGIIDSATANRSDLARSYCHDITVPSDPKWEACLEVALACDDEADDGPCGKIGSPAEIEGCTVAYKDRRAKLSEAQLAQAPAPEGGDYAEAMRSICIVEHLASE